MKRIVSIALVLMMLLSLCACGSSGEAATEPKDEFLVGYAKVDITPKTYGVPMDGHGNTSTRLSTGLMSYIYAIAVAVTDSEGNTAIMMAVDNCSTSRSICNSVRGWTQSQYGIPAENISISSLHQHTCPSSEAGNYSKYYVEKLKETITLALEDRAPAEMYMNRVETKALNAQRRVWLNDGGFNTSHSSTGDSASGFKAYESDPDREMRLIKFTREEGDDIIMVNFQCHPHMSSAADVTDIGADWPGEMRDVVAKELGVNVIYFSGAGGNMNSTSNINPEDNISTDWKHHGQRAAKYVIDAEDGYTKINTGTVACKEITNTYAADHSLDHLLPQATIVNQVKVSQGTEAARKLLKEYPELNSHFQASAIVSKASRGPTIDCIISVITFGDVAFTVHPYEMFDLNGKELREGTVGNANYAAEDQMENPFAMTFIATVANGSVGYVPSVNAYSNGGYEPDTTKYAAGTGELLVGDYLHMLNELYAN